MRSAWLLVPFMALMGCDSVVAISGTDGEGSTSAASSGPDTSPTASITDTSPPPTTTGLDPSTTTDNPPTVGNESSSGYASSSSGYASSSSTGYVGSSSSSESSSSTDPTGIGFIDPSDSGGDQECDPYLQDCPDGEKCNAWANDGGGAWNALGCFPLDPTPDQPGDPCQVEESGVSGIDTCALGSMCWDVDTETNIGTCVAMCEGSAAMPTCDDPGATCVISNNDALNLCLPACDPTMQTCGLGQGCYAIDDTFVCAPDGSAKQGAPGDPCEFLNACDPGGACVEAEMFGPSCASASCCSLFCNLSAPVCPTVGHECVPWFEEGAAPPMLVDVGVCAVPA